MLKSVGNSLGFNVDVVLVFNGPFVKGIYKWN